MKTNHGLSDPDACESRKDIEILRCLDSVELREEENWIQISMDDFLTEVEQRCQDLLHKIFDEVKVKQNDIFERMADICRPNPGSNYMTDLIEENSRSDADPEL